MKDDSSWEVKNYTQIFDCPGISTPNPCIVQRSIVIRSAYIFEEWEPSASSNLPVEVTGPPNQPA